MKRAILTILLLAAAGEASAQGVPLVGGNVMLTQAQGIPAIYIDGPLQPDTFQKLQIMINGHPPGATVVINSTGGNVDVAIAMGRMIRSARLRTHVAQIRNRRLMPGQCYSSCNYAFLGGVERSATPGSSFAVHQSLRSGDLPPRDLQEQILIASAALTEHVVQMGAAPQFAIAIMRTPHTTPMTIPPALLKQWRVTTR
jgi:hypothetical protein